MKPKKPLIPKPRKFADLALGGGGADVVKGNFEDPGPDSRLGLLGFGV